jgi:hypothetical protein
MLETYSTDEFFVVAKNKQRPDLHFGGGMERGRNLSCDSKNNDFIWHHFVYFSNHGKKGDWRIKYY